MKKLAVALTGFGALAILGFWLLATVHTTAEAGRPASATFSVRVMWGNSSNSSLTLWSWPQTKKVTIHESRTNRTGTSHNWEVNPSSTPFIVMPNDNSNKTEGVYVNEADNNSSFFWSHWNPDCSQGPELTWQVNQTNGINKIIMMVHNRSNATMFASFDSGVTWSSIEPNSILDGHSSARVGKVYFDWVPNDNPKPVEVCAYAFWNLDSFKFQEVETPTPTATATSSPTSSPVPPTSTPLATRYDFRLYDNQVTLGNQTTAQWVRFSYSGNRVVYSATIPSGLSLVGVAGCETGQGCEYKGYFADSSPVEIGQQARTEWVEAILKPTKAGTYSLTGHFQEPATGAFAFRTITLQVVDIANPTASPTSSPTATATATATSVKPTCPTVVNSMKFAIVYGDVFINGQPSPANSVIEVKNPRGQTIGCQVSPYAQTMQLMYVYGEESWTSGSTSVFIPGMRDGEKMTFYVNGQLATTKPIKAEWLYWSNDWNSRRIDLSVIIANTAAQPATERLFVPVLTTGKKGW